MKKLLKDYEFNTEEEYYQYIIDSYINGQPKQAEELFLKMPRAYRKQMIKEVVTGEIISGLPSNKIGNLIDLI